MHRFSFKTRQLSFFAALILSLCFFTGCKKSDSHSHGKDGHSHDHGKGKKKHDHSKHKHDKQKHADGKHNHGKHKHVHGKGKHAHGKHKHHHMQHDFSDVKRWVKIFDNPKRTLWQKPKEVVQHMKIKLGMVVADIGAGTGYFLPYLQAAVGKKGRVLALDVSKSLVDYMKKRAAKAGWKQLVARLIKTDDPGLAANSTDRILIVNTWHHIQDRVVYSKKMLTALKLGGFVVIVDFTKASKHGPRKEHRLTAEQVTKELENAGLRCRTLSETLPDQYIVIGMKFPPIPSPGFED